MELRNEDGEMRRNKRKEMSLWRRYGGMHERRKGGNGGRKRSTGGEEETREGNAWAGDEGKLRSWVYSVGEEE